MSAGATSHHDELQALLDGYDAPPAELPTLAEMRRVARHDEVFAASTYIPGHFTVSGFVTDPDRTRLVLVLHSRVGAWLQPGGHVERGDATLREALLRELAEETGLSSFSAGMDALFDIDVHEVPAHRNAPAHRHLDLRFHLTTEHVHLDGGPDGDEVRWVPLEDVGGWTRDASVLRAVGKLLAPGSADGRSRATP